MPTYMGLPGDLIKVLQAIAGGNVDRDINRKNLSALYMREAGIPGQDALTLARTRVYGGGDDALIRLLKQMGYLNQQAF